MTKTNVRDFYSFSLLLRAAEGEKKKDIARLVGSTADQVGRILAGKYENPTYPLMDWALDRTLRTGDPVERAMVHLAEALTPEQLDAVRATIRAFGLKAEPLRVIEQVKPGEVPELDAGGRTLKGVKPYPPAPGTNPKEGVAGEAPGAYASGIEEDAAAEVRARGGRMKRSKLSNVDLAKAKPVPPQDALRLFDEQTAAAKDTGGGKILGPIVEETEPAEVRYPRDTHYTLAVTGNSMYPRIFPGDRIIVERVSLHLPAYEQHRKIDPKPWKALDGEIVVAVKNQDEVSVVKRLCFTPKKDGSFRIDLMSDNPGARPIDIDKDDTLEVIGVVRQILRDPKNVG